MKIKIREYIGVTILTWLISGGLVFVFCLGKLPPSLTVFSLLFISVTLLALYRRRWTFWLFVGLLPAEIIIISPDDLPFSLRIFQLIAISLVVAITLTFLIYKSRKQTPKFNLIDKLVFAFPMFALLGIINAPVKSIAFKQIVVLIFFTVVYWMTRSYLQNRQQKMEAVWFTLAGSLPVLFFSLYQAIAYKVGWRSFEVFSARVNGFFTEPDWLGMYLTFLAAMVLWLKFVAGEKEKSVMIGSFKARTILELILNAYLLLVVSVLVLTVARSAWLGFFAMAVCYLIIVLFFSRDEKGIDLLKFLKELAILVCIVLGSYFGVIYSQLSSFNITDRAASSVSGKQLITISCEKDFPVKVPREINSIDILDSFGCRHIGLEEIEAEKLRGREIREVLRPDPNVNIRRETYVTIFKKIKEHPFLGYGIGSSAVFLGNDDHGSGLNSSNLLLEIWFSAGLFGLLIWLFILGYLLYQGILGIYYNSTKKGSGRYFSIFLILTFVSIAVPNLFNSGLFLAFSWVWLAAVAEIKNSPQ